MIDYAQRPRQKERIGIGQIIFLLLMAITLSWAVARGLDTTFENQDRMNCRSAKVSGNEEWLAKCQCFYQGEPITCIQGKETHER